MQTAAPKDVFDPAYLRLHFQNYLELMLGAERSKLQNVILSASNQATHQDIFIEIDYRINYLKGAVRMGKLLCLIDDEEAKAHAAILRDERERLRTSALITYENISPKPESPNNSDKIKSILRSLSSAPGSQ